MYSSQIHESDGSFLRITFCIDDGLYFALSEGALNRFKNYFPTRFTVDLQGTVHWYTIPSRIHQDNRRNIKIDQANIALYLDGEGMKSIHSALNQTFQFNAYPK
jgi:hypothetical protein